MKRLTYSWLRPARQAKPSLWLLEACDINLNKDANNIDTAEARLRKESRWRQ